MQADNWGDRAQRGGADLLQGGGRACATSQPLLRAGAGWQADQRKKKADVPRA